MKLNSPLFLAVRVLVYSLLMVGIAQGIFYDAGHPFDGDYFGEITFTEISQEIILFLLFGFYLFLGKKLPETEPVSSLVGLFFLLSFVREFNFLPFSWLIPASIVLVVFIIVLIRNFKKMGNATLAFFGNPASGWLLAGLIITFVFSRLFGRSKFWLLLYSEDNYRLAKAAVEEGIELLGNSIMLIGAFEFFIYYWFEVRVKNEKL